MLQDISSFIFYKATLSQFVFAFFFFDEYLPQADIQIPFEGHTVIMDIPSVDIQVDCEVKRLIRTP